MRDPDLTSQPHSRTLALLVMVAQSWSGGCSNCRNSFSVELFGEQSGTTVNLRGVAARVDGPVIAVGDGGTILVRDVEASWTKRDSGTSQNILAITSSSFSADPPPENDSWIAVGSSGLVLTSHDAEMWIRRDSGSDADLHAVMSLGGTVVLAVGDGVILRSGDGGVTWQPATVSGEVGVLRAVNARLNPYGNTREVYAAGDGGQVLLSTDYGLGWDPIDVGTTSDLRAVSMQHLAFQQICVLGLGGAARCQLDPGGKEWEKANVKDPTDFLGVSRDGEWYVGSDGTLRGSLEGGAVGEFADGAPNRAPLFAIDGTSDGMLDKFWAAGADGVIIRIEAVITFCPPG